MACPRRDQVRRDWNCGANGGWRGDDGQPERQARRSAGVHGASRGYGGRFGGSVVCGNGPDEGFGGGEGAGRVHAWSKAADVTEVVVGERGRMTGMVREGGGTNPPKPIPGTEGSQGVKPQGLMR